jgi:hypothetical protein
MKKADKASANKQFSPIFVTAKFLVKICTVQNIVFATTNLNAVPKPNVVWIVTNSSSND